MTAPPAKPTAICTGRRAETASGLPTSGCSGYSGCGSIAAISIISTGPAAATLAHHRHRGEGSDPVGVSSSTNPAQAIHCTTRPLLRPAR